VPLCVPPCSHGARGVAAIQSPPPRTSLHCHANRRCWGRCSPGSLGHSRGHSQLAYVPWEHRPARLLPGVPCIRLQGCALSAGSPAAGCVQTARLRDGVRATRLTNVAVANGLVPHGPHLLLELLPAHPHFLSLKPTYQVHPHTFAKPQPVVQQYIVGLSPHCIEAVLRSSASVRCIHSHLNCLSSMPSWSKSANL
jgi:hypothetical protein